MTVDALGMLLGILAVILTLAMFVTRESMLGLPSAIFWAVLSGFSYNQSAATWDIHYFLFFGAIGMTIFCTYAAYGLRERRDTIADEELEQGEGEYIGEKPEKKDKTWYEDDGIPDNGDASRPRARAAQRRANAKRKGESS